LKQDDAKGSETYCSIHKILNGNSRPIVIDITSGSAICSVKTNPNCKKEFDPFTESVFDEFVIPGTDDCGILSRDNASTVRSSGSPYCISIYDRQYDFPFIGPQLRCFASSKFLFLKLYDQVTKIDLTHFSKESPKLLEVLPYVEGDFKDMFGLKGSTLYFNDLQLTLNAKETEFIKKYYLESLSIVNNVMFPVSLSSHIIYLLDGKPGCLRVVENGSNPVTKNELAWTDYKVAKEQIIILDFSYPFLLWKLTSVPDELRFVDLSTIKQSGGQVELQTNLPKETIVNTRGSLHEKTTIKQSGGQVELQLGVMVALCIVGILIIIIITAKLSWSLQNTAVSHINKQKKMAKKKSQNSSWKHETSSRKKRKF